MTLGGNDRNLETNGAVPCGLLERPVVIFICGTAVSKERQVIHGKAQEILLSYASSFTALCCVLILIFSFHAQAGRHSRPSLA